MDDAWTRLPAVGDVLGRYELLREVGRGGFGVVFEARDGELGRSVALKVLRPATRSRALLGSEALRREADAASQLNHPGIATLHDLGRWEGWPFLVYELLRGETLEERLHRGPVELAETLRIGREIAGALACAHAAGVVHRDLKPGNVFLCEDGRAKLLDFGLAHVAGGRASPAGGTPAFMAPEAWRGEAEDARSDVFAAGVILHELLTGAAPYPVVAGRSAVLDGIPAPAPRVRGAPGALLRLVQRAVSPDPAARPRDGRALEEELRAISAGIEAAPRRRRALAGAVAAAALGAAAIGLVTLRPQPSGPPVAALADATNETGEHVLDAISGLLTTSLEQSRQLRVVPRTQLFDLARDAGLAPERLDAATLRKVAGRAGATVIVAPTIRRTGDGFALEVELLDARSDRRLETLADRVRGLPQIPALVGAVGERLRRSLAEPDADIAATRLDLGKVVTADLNAYRHLYEGQDCIERPSRGAGWSRLDCAVHFERAIERDPSFALAHYELARLSAHDGSPPEVERARLAAATRTLDRLPDKERLLVLAWTAQIEGDTDRALETYRVLAARHPGDKRIAFLAGDLEFHRGRIAEAVPWLERVLELDPEHEWALDHLVPVLGRLEDRGRLERLERRLDARPRTAGVLHALSRARGWLGDYEGALAAARLETELGSPAAGGDTIRALLFAGRLDEAEALARRRAEAAGPAEAASHGPLLAGLLVRQGRWREARAELERGARACASEVDCTILHKRAAHLLLGRLDGAGVRRHVKAFASVDPQGAATFAVHLAYLGDPGGSRALAARLSPAAALARLHAAVVAWRAGDPASAAGILRDVDANSPRQELAGLPVEATAFLAAEAQLDAGDRAGALDALRRFQRLYENNWWWPWAYPRSRLLAARALRELGRPEEARAEVAELLRTLGRADADDPVLVEARRLAAALGEPAGHHAP